MIKGGKCQCIIRQDKFPELLQLQNINIANSKHFLEKAWRELQMSLFHMSEWLLDSLDDLYPSRLLYPSISVQGV